MLMRGRLKYYWIIPVICGLMLISCLLFGGTVITIYTAVIAEDMGMSRSEFSLFFTIRAIVSFILNLEMICLMRHLRLKTIVVWGLAMLAAMLFLLSVSHSLALMCFAGILGGAANTFTGVVPVSLIVRNWFKTSQGMVLALVMSASGIGGVVINPVLSIIIGKNGWRFGFQMLVSVVLIILVMTMLLLKAEPGEAGLLPYGAKKKEPNENRPPKTESSLSLFGKSKEESNLRIFILMNVFFSMGALSLYSNISSVLMEMDFSIVFSTGIAISVISLANCAGKFIMGTINDRYSTKNMLLVWYGLCPLAGLFFLLYRGNTSAVALAGAALIGSIGGIYTVPTPLVSMRLFADNDTYTCVVSYCTAASSLSSAFSGLLFHGFYDYTGTYKGALFFTVVLSMMCYYLVIRLLHGNRTVFFTNARQINR